MTADRNGDGKLEMEEFAIKPEWSESRQRTGQAPLMWASCS